MEDNQGSTALHLASYEGHVEVVIVLLEAMPAEERAGYVQMADNQGRTALHVALSEGHAEVVGVLREAMPVEEEEEGTGLTLLPCNWVTGSVSAVVLAALLAYEFSEYVNN